MQKRAVKRSGLSVSHVPKLNPYTLKKINLENSEVTKVQKQISPAVAKWSFVLLMILIFFALSYNPASITSYSVINTTKVNPGLNLTIFFGLLALVFFLTYEKSKKIKKSK
jgi:protein-S-isoprenylcysteine O-methyltransferase Ste14